MPDPISRVDVRYAFDQMGYERIAELGDFDCYQDPDTGFPLLVAFSDDEIAWVNLMKILEYEGVNPATFVAALES